MYDKARLKERMVVCGFNHYRLAVVSKVDPKTAKKVVETGVGHAECVYRIAKTLGFDVKKEGRGRTARYDLAAILGRHNGGNGKKSA